MHGHRDIRIPSFLSSEEILCFVNYQRHHAFKFKLKEFSIGIAVLLPFPLASGTVLPIAIFVITNFTISGKFRNQLQLY